MAFTTGVYDEMERQNARVPRRLAPTTGGGGSFADAPASAPNEGGRSFGFRAGVGGTAERHLGEAVAAGAGLGEPTSFRAGAGAPTPIGVIRGTRQTFATETGGPQLEEFATPLQARQASNRFRAGEAEVAAGKRGFTDPTIAGRFGEYRPAGQTMEEIKATKEGPGMTAFRTAQAGLLKGQTEEAARKETATAEKQRVSQFETGFLKKHGVATPKEKGAGMDYAMPKDVNPADYESAAEIARTQGHEAGLAHYGERQLARKWLEGQDTRGVNINAYLGAVASDPRAWAELMGKARAANLGTSQPPVKPWYETAADQFI